MCIFLQILKGIFNNMLYVLRFVVKECAILLGSIGENCNE